MISKLLARTKSLWQGIRRRSELEAEMRDEFRLHVELRAADLERTGLSSSAALRQARQEFGSIERYKHEARATRGLHRVDEIKFSWLDFKLGFRMLARYPGLTVVGGLAMAFAIWMGACTFELISQWLRPNLALEDDQRIVGIHLVNMSARQQDRRALYDFSVWRRELRSIAGLSAFRSLDRNLFTSATDGAPVEVAEVTASTFGVTRVAALLGRVLVEADEQPGAPPVMVVSYQLWRERLGGDPNVIGHTVRLGTVQTTVVGVMPRRFAFPVYHQVWTPLRLNAVTYGPLQGPEIRVFGRLADGITMAGAQSELSHLGQRTAADFPETHQHLEPRIVPYARSIVTLSPGEFSGLRVVNVAVVMLIVLVCGNVALLLFARAATRESEVVVRNALGASRGRIIMQLFAEALVLGAVGTVVGLAAARFGMRWAVSMLQANLGDLPYWVNDHISRTTILYALGLTLLGAVVSGVVPALRVTRSVGTQLRQAGAGGGGLRFSGFWTVVIVAQIAVTLTFPVVSLMIWRGTAHMRSFELGFAGEDYMSVRLELDAENAAGLPVDSSYAAYVARYRRTYQELRRRLSADAAVEGVTFANRLPLMHHPTRQVEMVEDVPAARDSVSSPPVKVASIDIDYLNVVGAPILAGRGFHAADMGSDRRVVIVNQSFVTDVLRGRNAVGRRVRITNREDQEDAPAPELWYEIVGVVRDLGMDFEVMRSAASGAGRAGIYHPLSAHAGAVFMVVKVRDNRAVFAARLRAVTQAVDPTLRLYDLQPVTELRAGFVRFISVYIRTALVMSTIALMLSLAGIYAVMSFAVARRTREIGIRVALGADARRVLLAVFRRPLTQLTLGILVGSLLVTILVRSVVGDLSAREVGLIAAYAAFMMGVCLLACIVPTRRALGVQPIDALRVD
ncbi:MAG: ABC transporter permease [Longimicrobiales bacterium]